MSIHILVETTDGIESFTVARPEDHSLEVIEGVLRLELVVPREVRSWAPGEWRSTHSRTKDDE